MDFEDIERILELVRQHELAEFELETDGENYIVKSDFLTKTGEWILRHALSPNDTSDQSVGQSAVNRSACFSPADISRLDDQAQKQRRNRFTITTKIPNPLFGPPKPKISSLNIVALRLSWINYKQRETLH